MPITVASRRSLATLQRHHPDAVIVDVTSKGQPPFVQLSPFFPVGDIPVPYSPGTTSASVEGIWQGLKVFDNHDVDPCRFTNTSMKNLKRTVRKYGPCRGHRRGLHGDELLSHVDARKLIYVPTYEYVLDVKLPHLVLALRDVSRTRDVVLLDFETNGDIDDVTRPLSHAHLVARHVRAGLSDGVGGVRHKKTPPEGGAASQAWR